MSGRAVRNHLRSGVSARVLIVALGVPLVVGAPSAWAGGALPTTGKYVAGTGAISKKGASGLTVNQNSGTGIIDWSSFSIGKGNSVQFNNGAGATLNRVTGGDLSTIAGSLKATGSLYLINPQGVIVSVGGKVVTGGSFIASSRDESDSDFLGGKQKFSGTSNGNVFNAGTIKSANGDVTLIGNSVSNSGSMSAKNGSASLNAGNQVLLAPAGSRILVNGGAGSASNSGTLQAAQAQINAAGGNVYAIAGNNGGIVRATGTSTINGHVWLTSGSGNAEISGKVSATNVNGSGGAVTARANNIVISGNVDVSATKSTMLGGSASIIAADTTN
jgi:filamentous hemagglutinin family protein